MTNPTASGATTGVSDIVTHFHGVRYVVSDVARAIDFYTTRLGFKVAHQQLPAFAMVTLESLKILLSGPEASGSRPLPGGEPQKSGGSNRVVLRVDDLPAELADVYRFAEEVVKASGEEDSYRERIRGHYGEEGLVELAMGIAFSRVFPTTKRALGYAKSCSVVRVEV